MIAVIFGGIVFSADAQRSQSQRGQERMDPEKRAEMRVNKLAERLDLTEAQREQVFELQLEQEREQDAARQARREEMKENREQMFDRRTEQNEKIEKLLTPEQREKWIEIRNEEREKRDIIRDAQGNPDNERIRKHRRGKRGGGGHR